MPNNVEENEYRAVSADYFRFVMFNEIWLI